MPLVKTLITILILCITSSAIAQTPSYVPTNGLIGWWPFNGNANDESGNGNNGTVDGATLTTDRFGMVDKAYGFDGVNDFISVQSLNAMPYTPITYSVWLYNEMPSIFPLSPGFKFKAIIGRNTAFVEPCGVLGIGADGNYMGGAYDNQASFWRGGGITGQVPFSNIVIGLNTWVQLALTQESNGNWKFFVNGTLTNQGNFTDVLNYYDFFQIGSCNNQSNYNTFWQGKLDDIGIWNRALSETEIATLYAGCNLSVTTQPQDQSVNASAGTVSFNTFSSSATATYQWQTNLGVGFQNLSNAGQYSGATSATLTVSNLSMSNNNQVFRCIINDGACADTTAEALLNIIDDAGLQSNPQITFKLYPNPVKDELYIKGMSEAVLPFEVHSTDGKKVLSGTTSGSIDVNALKKGSYLLKMKEQTIPFVKQ